VKIPDKIFFKIGEVSEILGVETHTLRYWEGEFQNLKKIKKNNGQRLYTKEDIKKFIEIKELLYNKKFTIKGAQKYLSTSKKEKLFELKKSLLEIKEILQQI